MKYVKICAQTVGTLTQTTQPHNTRVMLLPGFMSDTRLLICLCSSVWSFPFLFSFIFLASKLYFHHPNSKEGRTDKGGHRCE